MKQWAAKCKKTELLIQRFLTNCLNNFTASPTTQASAWRTSPPPPGTWSSSSSSSDSTHRGTQSRPRKFCVIFRRWQCERLQISTNRVVFMPDWDGQGGQMERAWDSTHRGTSSRPRIFCVIFRRWKCESLQISSIDWAGQGGQMERTWAAAQGG